jgi:phosphatidylethanolamine/phosphatidyl-N-methylethanolamine N-methyltransferase
MDLLEVGVGTGLSLPMLPRNVTITGIDLSEKMLQQARKRLSSEDLHENVELIKMDATYLQFPDDSFDRVLAAYFISTVPDPVSVVKEMKRVCRPGGYLVFLNHFQNEMPVIGHLEKYLSPVFYRLGFRTDLDVHELMRECDLEIETLERIDFLGHWKAVRSINRK